MSSDQWAVNGQFLLDVIIAVKGIIKGSLSTFTYSLWKVICLLTLCWNTSKTISFGDADSHLAIQEISDLMKPKVQLPFPQSNNESFVQSPSNHRRLRSRLVIYFHLCLGLHSGFLAKILYEFPSHPCMLRSPPISYVYLYLIALMMFWEQQPAKL